MDSDAADSEHKRLVDEVDQLKAALASRTVIGEALGMLMERHAISADEAFAELRSVSQTTNVKLAEVALKLVATGQFGDAQESGPAD